MKFKSRFKRPQMALGEQYIVNGKRSPFIVKEIGCVPFWVCSDCSRQEECIERLDAPEDIPEEWYIECCKSYLDREVEK